MDDLNLARHRTAAEATREALAILGPMLERAADRAGWHPPEPTIGRSRVPAREVRAGRWTLLRRR